MSRRHYNLRKGESTLLVTYMRETKDSWYLDIGKGDLIWFPKKHCTYDKEKGTIKVPNEFLKKQDIDVNTISTQ